MKPDRETLQAIREAHVDRLNAEREGREAARLDTEEHEEKMRALAMEKAVAEVRGTLTELPIAPPLSIEGRRMIGETLREAFDRQVKLQNKKLDSIGVKVNDIGRRIGTNSRGPG